jgi:hypothetical protein
VAIELAVVFFFFKETQGMSLEETSAIFDGPDAIRNVACAADIVEIRDGTPEGKEKDFGGETVQALQ